MGRRLRSALKSGFVALLAALGPFVLTTSAQGGRKIPTLAVLDFENTSKNPKLDGVGNGIAETLITELGQMRGIRVVERKRLHDALAAARRAEGAEVRPIPIRGPEHGAAHRKAHRRRPHGGGRLPASARAGAADGAAGGGEDGRGEYLFGLTEDGHPYAMKLAAPGQATP